MGPRRLWYAGLNGLMGQSMHRIPQSVDKKLWPLRIHLDEVAELDTILRAHCKKVTLVIDAFELDTLAEINTLQKSSTTRLSFQCYEPFIRIVLNEWHGVIQANEDDPVILGVVERCVAVLRPFYCRARYVLAQIAHYNWLLPGGAGGAMGYFYADPWTDTAAKQMFFAAVTVFAVWVIWAVWSWRFLTLRYNVIYLTKRLEAPSFWARQKDNLIVNGLVAIVSAAIGAAVAILLGAQ